MAQKLTKETKTNQDKTFAADVCWLPRHRRRSIASLRFLRYLLRSSFWSPGVKSTPRCAVGAGEFTQRGRQDFHLVAGRSPFDLRQAFAQRCEKGLARARDAAANDDRFRIQNVDERCNGTRQGPDGA